MCSDERNSRRSEMQSGKYQNDSVAEGWQYNEIGEEKEGNFMHFMRRSENNQNEFVKEGNLLRLNGIGDEEEENEDSGDMRSCCENDRKEFVNEGNFMHFTEIRDEEEETEKSKDLRSLCKNNQNELEKEGNFMQFNEIRDEEKENEKSGDLRSLFENKQNELVKEGNFMHFTEIRDEDKENEKSGDLRSLCENNQNEFVKEGNFMHFTEIRDEEEETEKSEDLRSLCENNQNEFVKDGEKSGDLRSFCENNQNEFISEGKKSGDPWSLGENNQKELVKEGDFTHFHEFCDENDHNEEPGDLWSLCEPAKNHFESLLGYDGLSPVSNPEPRSAPKNFFCNDSLHFCTESLGFESSDEREDCNAGFSENLGSFREEKVEAPDVAAEKHRYAPGHSHMGAKKRAAFPPPLTWLKSPLLLKPSRKEGRFIIREVEEHEAPTPRHEILQAWRENGRLRLHLISEKPLHFIDTSMQSDTSLGDNGLNAEPRLTSSLPSVDENSVPRPPGLWSATWENECVEFPRADVSLPLFAVPLERCQESTACLSTWNPRCITT